MERNEAISTTQRVSKYVPTLNSKIMTADYCKDCVFWIMARCDGMEDPSSCWDKETYDDWDYLDELVIDSREV